MKVLVTYVIDSETGNMEAPETIDTTGADAIVQPLDAAGHKWAVDTGNDDAMTFAWREDDIWLGLARLAAAKIRERDA